MAPPAKRRKRNVVHESDDEEEQAKPSVNTLANYLFSSPDAKFTSQQANSQDGSPSPSPQRKPSRTSTRQTSKPALKPLRSQKLNGVASNGNKSTSTSPEKAKIKAPVKVKQPEKGKTADLKSLFSKQAERAASKPPTQIDDITSDPISDEDDVGEHRAATASRVGSAARKRFGTQTAPTIATSSQKFLRPPAPPPQQPPVDNDEQRPWSERFAPKNLEELAVHKKKVTDVRKWLEDVIAGRMRQRLLILKGAAGTGKTTTMRLLAKEMHCELLEWRNPTVSAGGLGFQSVSAQFEEFMGRGGKFSQLDIISEESEVERNDAKDDRQKIILIEEFPNTFARSSTAMTSFRNAILSYLATNVPSLSFFATQNSHEPVTPIVMVISETLLTTTSASADSFTAHRLLGPDIMRHPGTAIIEFNAIAPTLLAAALEMIVQKEAKKSGRRRTPGPLVLKKLGEIGDIRSAISSLQFLCLKGDSDADWGSKVGFTKPKRSLKTSVALTQGEVETLQMVSQREASLGIFHAVGKVVYNKRGEQPLDPDSDAGRSEIYPEYLAHLGRPRKSEVDVDALMDETGTDAHTFISALHENYILSCEPSTPRDANSFLDYSNGCIDYLSDSDLLCPSWDVFFGGRGGGWSGKDSASHMLRQEEITFQVATRGLLFSLPHPVKRIASGSRRGGDAFKMFYPTSLKLWREKEEIEGCVSSYTEALLRGQGGIDANATGTATTASAWARRGAANTQQSQSQRPSATQGEDQSTATSPLLSLGSGARRELLLERLPYTAHIMRRQRRHASSSSAKLKDIERIVSFSGISGLGDEEDAVDAEDQPAEEWATDRNTEDRSPRKKRGGWRTGKEEEGSGSGLGLGERVRGLVISDDDIEDD